MTAHSDQTILILVVDDHQVVRQGLRYLRPARHRHRRIGAPYAQDQYGEAPGC